MTTPRRARERTAWVSSVRDGVWLTVRRWELTRSFMLSDQASVRHREGQTQGGTDTVLSTNNHHSLSWDEHLGRIYIFTYVTKKRLREGFKKKKVGIFQQANSSYYNTKPSQKKANYKYLMVVGVVVGGWWYPSDYFVSTQLQLWLFCCWGCGCCWAVTTM